MPYFFKNFNLAIRQGFLIIFFLSLLLILKGQERGAVEAERVFVKEWNATIKLHTNGFGVGFQHGRMPNYFDKHFWEINFQYVIHPKSVRARNPYYTGTSAYVYGKLVDLFLLRGGYGYQRTLHHKPYWGGVQINYNVSGGFSLGMAMPIYLYISYITPAGYSQLSEQYDPAIHNIDNIVQRGPLLEGIFKTTFHPGFYLKSGLNFDFSKKENIIHRLEIGLVFDMVFPVVQQMAYNKANLFYLSGYLAYNIGKKKGLYE